MRDVLEDLKERESKSLGKESRALDAFGLVQHWLCPLLAK